MVTHGQIWTRMGRYGHMWADLDSYEQLWAGMDKYGQTWERIGGGEWKGRSPPNIQSRSLCPYSPQWWHWPPKVHPEDFPFPLVPFPPPFFLSISGRFRDTSYESRTRAVALFNFYTSNPKELSFEKGSIIYSINGTFISSKET